MQHGVVLGAGPDDGALAAVKACRDTPEAAEFVACLSASGVNWDEAFRAEFLCEVLSNDHFVHRDALLIFAIQQISPGAVLSRLAQVDGVCAELMWSSDMFSEALLEVRTQNHSWWNKFQGSIDLPAVAGSGLSSFGARLVGLLACGGASELAALTDNIAMGDGNATFEQMREAIMFSILRRNDAVDVLLFADELLASPGFARTPRASEILTRMLLSPVAWPDANPAPALDSVQSLLASQDFSAPTALYILVNTSDLPPHGVDADRWRAIRRACEELARKAGWVYR